MYKIKVHPNVAASSPAVPAAEGKGEAVSLTVWRRSLLFNGKGFTVFDTNGNLVFRVETHAREVVLMDADGLALLTVRRKKLSLAEEWLVYDGDGDEAIHGAAEQEPAPDQVPRSSVAGPIAGRYWGCAWLPVRCGGLVRQPQPRHVRLHRRQSAAARGHGHGVPEGSRRRPGRVQAGGGARLGAGARHGRGHSPRSDERVLKPRSIPGINHACMHACLQLQHPAVPRLLPCTEFPRFPE